MDGKILGAKSPANKKCAFSLNLKRPDTYLLLPVGSFIHKDCFHVSGRVWRYTRDVRLLVNIIKLDSTIHSVSSGRRKCTDEQEANVTAQQRKTP